MAARPKATTASGYSRIPGSNEKVRIAVMGTNSRGHGLARNFVRLPGAEVVCICDVDKRAVEKTRAHVREHQSAAPKGTADLRHVLEDTSVDALVIAAPDHWHAPAAILALKAGPPSRRGPPARGEAGIPGDKLEELAKLIRAEFPFDEMMYELHFCARAGRSATVTSRWSFYISPGLLETLLREQ